MGQISGTQGILLREYWEKSMIIGEKMLTYIDWQGD